MEQGILRDNKGRYIKGSHGFNNKGNHLSEEHKKKISEGNKGKMLGYKFPKEIFKTRGMSGKLHSEETKIKISNSKKGGCTWNKGKRNIYSVETLNKIREARAKQIMEPCSEEKKVKIREHNLGKKRSEATKIKLKIVRSKRIFPTKDTSIEIKIQSFLKQLGISFLTHQYIKDIEHGYQCDILIPSMNLVIECDGDYWHKYPIGNDIDHIRTSELLEKGFNILRLWEHEIRVMNVNEFQNRIRGGIKI